jgi:hypothetical protein
LKRKKIGSMESEESKVEKDVKLKKINDFIVTNI